MNARIAGVRGFFAQVQRNGTDLYLSAITIGELRRGADLMRHRDDSIQATHLDNWLAELLTEYTGNVLAFDQDVALLWGSIAGPLSRERH